MAVRAMVESGESFARLLVATDATTIPLHLELLDREQVPMDLHREIGGGARIRAGIEFDTAGRRVAYRVLSSRPGDPLGSLRMDPLRVPAADCLHLFKPLAAGLIQFSARPEVKPVWQDVLGGILRHVSVGYSVEDWAETTENGARVLTAVRWTPHEISLVPTPADPGAHSGWTAAPYDRQPRQRPADIHRGI